MEKHILSHQGFEKFQEIARNSHISRKIISENFRGSCPNVTSEIKQIFTLKSLENYGFLTISGGDKKFIPLNSHNNRNLFGWRSLAHSFPDLKSQNKTNGTENMMNECHGSKV